MIRGAPPKEYREIPSLLIQRALKEQAGLAKSAVGQISNKYVGQGGFILLLDISLVRYERSVKEAVAERIIDLLASQEEDTAEEIVKDIKHILADSPNRIAQVLKLIDLERRYDMVRAAENPQLAHIELLLKVIQKEKRERVVTAAVMELVNPLQSIPIETAVELAADAMRKEKPPWQLLSIFKKMLPGRLDNLEPTHIANFLAKMGTIRHPDEIELIGSILLRESNSYELKAEAARMLGTGWSVRALNKLGLGIRDPNPVLRRNIYEYAKQAYWGSRDLGSKEIAEAAEDILLAGVGYGKEDPRLRIDLLRWFAENGNKHAVKVLAEIDVANEEWDTILKGAQEKHIKSKLAQAVEQTIGAIKSKGDKIRHERITDPVPKAQTNLPKKERKMPTIPPSKVGRNAGVYVQVRNSTDMEELARRNLRKKRIQGAIEQAKEAPSRLQK